MADEIQTEEMRVAMLQAEINRLRDVRKLYLIGHLTGNDHRANLRILLPADMA